MSGRPLHYLSMLAVLTVAGAVIWAAVQLAPEPILRDRMLVIPGGWWRALIIFATAVVAVAASAYLYGLATRPLRAARYALTAGTHLFLWGVIIGVFYPVVYLLAVSFNRSDTLAGALPKVGNLLVRAGVLPNPRDLSLIQYAKVLRETHLSLHHWLLTGVVAAAIITMIGALLLRRAGLRSLTARRVTQLAGWTLFAAAALLVLTISPQEFYGVSSEGRRLPASIGGMVPLYIRNTLLISGSTGVLAVLLSTTAGYAFSRLKFEGRYTTLLTFVFVQMFPTFMTLVAIFYLMSRLELLNTFTGLILAYSGGAIAFSTWIFKGYLDSLSPSLEEQAMVDGATRFGAFWRVILPLSVPMLLFIFLNQFIGTYSEFILANTLLVGQDLWTVGVGLRNFTTGQFATQWGAMAAAAVLGSLPILAIFYSFQEALTGQYTAGSVKE